MDARRYECDTVASTSSSAVLGLLISLALVDCLLVEHLSLVVPRYQDRVPGVILVAVAFVFVCC
jgi:hypothetical protein